MNHGAIARVRAPKTGQCVVAWGSGPREREDKGDLLPLLSHMISKGIILYLLDFIDLILLT